nr:retrovirus-related Pol polyprotein from transposon TNT 1-94 [Tanacetum cinerariifolium]
MIGLPKLQYVKDQLCSSCELSKAKRSSFKSKVVPSSKGRLNLLHMDLCGPMQVVSINGKKYIMVIVDDYSRYTWTLFLRSKDETPEVLKDFLTMIQRNLQALMITVCTDRGTEFLNKTLNAFFKEEVIEHQTSTARTPEQNGIVERWNRTLVEAARTMLSTSQLPLFFWAEAIATAYYTQNQSIIIPTHDKTPYHIINDRKPSIKHLYIFDGENLDTMKEKGDQCILASDYDNPDPVPQRQDVYSSADADVPSQQELDILFGPLYDEFFNTGSNPSTNIQSTSAPSTHTNVNAEKNNNDQAEEGEHIPDDEFTNPLCASTQEVAKSSSYNIEQVHGNPLRPVQTRRQLATDPEMCMYALTGNRCHNNIETNQLLDNRLRLSLNDLDFQSLGVTPKLRCIKPDTTRYLPKERKDASAKPHHIIASSNSRISSKNISRFSSNDMVHNHYLEEAKKRKQERSRNSEPSLIPSARLQRITNGSKPMPRRNTQTFRIWPATKNSFVMTKTVPIAEHPRNSRNDSCVTKFLKEVNSHAKVPSNKTTNRNKPVEQIGVPNKQERQIPTGHSSELRLHDHINEQSSSKLVPDVIPQADRTSTSRQMLELLFHHHLTMLRKKTINRDASPSTHTNVHVEENNNDQAEEGEQVQDDEFTNPFCAPAQEQVESSSHNIGNSNVPTFNQLQVFEYQWTKYHPLEQVRGNPSRPVQTRRQLATDPKMYGFVNPGHPEKVYRLRKSLYRLKQALTAWYDELSKFLISKGFTKGLQIQQSLRGIFINQAKYTLEILHKYGMDKGQSIGTPIATKPKLDADLSGNLVDQTDYRSKIGSLMYLTSSRLDIVQTNCTAMSSAEAEYVALSASCAQVMWIRTQLQDYGFNYNKIPLYCDSQSAISISCNSVQHSHTKHIHTRYHFIKEQVENGITELYFVRTEYQLADMFTKVIPEDRFKYLVRRIGMRCLTPAELEVLAKESA